MATAAALSTPDCNFGSWSLRQALSAAERVLQLAKVSVASEVRGSGAR